MTPETGGRKTFSDAPEFNSTLPEEAKAYTSTPVEGQIAQPVDGNLRQRIDYQRRRVVSGLKGVGRAAKGAYDKGKTAIEDDPTSATNKRDIKEDSKIILRRAAQLGLLLTIVAGLAKGCDVIAPIAGKFASEQSKKVSSAISDNAEPITKQDEVVKLVQSNIDSVKIKEADGVTLQEYKRNIAIRNEIIKFAMYDKNAGVKGIMNEINSSPVYAKETVFFISTLQSETFKMLMDGRKYKDGITRTSFSLIDIDSMNPKDREDAIYTLAAMLTHTISIAYMTDMSRLPRDSMLYDFIEPFRTAYLGYTNGLEVPTEPVTALVLGEDKKGTTHVIGSQLYRAPESERSPDFDSIFKDPFQFLRLFSGSRYYP